MAELELMWVKECEVCGREHRQADQVTVESIEEAEGAAGSFYERCEQWYLAHVENMYAQHLVRAGAPA